MLTALFFLLYCIVQNLEIYICFSYYFFPIYEVKIILNRLLLNKYYHLHQLADYPSTHLMASILIIQLKEVFNVTIMSVVLNVVH